MSLLAGFAHPVKPAASFEHVDIALPRASVLAGRITDDVGEPFAGVRVEVMDVRYIRGRRIPVQARAATTNDIGQFRIGGLEPGSYYLRATTPETWEGDDERRETYAYAQTFYPGVKGADQAQIINLGVGQETANLDFPLLPGRAARISGVLLNAAGEPMAAQRVNADYIQRGVGGSLFSAGFGGGAVTDPDGVFEFRNLPPGEYNIYTTIQDERAAVAVTLADFDVFGVALTPRRPSSLSGSIVTDERGAPPFAAGRLRVLAIAAGRDSVLPAWGAPTAQTPRPDWSFRFVSIDGPYLLRVSGLPDEWMLKAVQLGDRDVTDAPLDVPKGGSETSGVRLVLSRKSGTITGQVVDRNGAPLADSTVIVFEADPARWQPATRFVKTTRSGSDGRYSVSGLPPGSYRAIAKDFVADGQWEDPGFLQSLSPDAARVELREGAPETLTLKMEQP